MDMNGANQKQLTFGKNESEPNCSNDAKWVYFLDHADNRYVKRVPVDGGTPETVVKTSVGQYALSPDGKRIISNEVREEDHKLVARIDTVEDHRTQYVAIDQRASQAVKFAPNGKDIVFIIQEKGVDNLWTQALDGSPAKQVTHFSADSIYSFGFSRDGSKLALDRGHPISDAILLRDNASK